MWKVVRKNKKYDKRKLIVYKDNKKITEAYPFGGWYAMSERIDDETIRMTCRSLILSELHWLITGSLGLWYGVRDIDMTYEKTLADAIKRCIGSCDDAIIKKRGSVIYVPGLHHDGRNHFEVRALSDIGINRLERNGEISIKNRRNFVTLPKYLF